MTTDTANSAPSTMLRGTSMKRLGAGSPPLFEKGGSREPSCVDCGGDHPSGHPWHTPPGAPR